MDYKAELIRLKQYLQTEIQFITDEDSVPDKFARQANRYTLAKVEQILIRGEADTTNESSGLYLQRVTNCPLCGGETTFEDDSKCMTADCSNCIF